MVTENRNISNADGPHICILGAGAWGTALAQVLAREGRAVTLIARDKALAADIMAVRENITYLKGITLHPLVSATADDDALKQADIILLATPAQHLRETLVRIKGKLKPQASLINTAKGIEAATGNLLSAIAAAETPEHPYAVLSGPTFAHEVASGLPTALTLACQDGDTALTLANAIRSPHFRPYLSTDVIGVEVAGALKNVMAIACGIVEGRNLGQNARAAVMTRGMAEIRRIGMAVGAQGDTFLGLAGLGDLMLTCNSMASRNFSLGVALGKGEKLHDILSRRVTVAEGVATAKAARQFALTHQTDMPISAAVYHILYDNASVDDVIAGLLSRHLKTESE